VKDDLLPRAGYPASASCAHETCRYQNLALSRVPPGFRGRSGPVVLLWQFVQATIFAWSPQPAYAWRRMLLRLFGAQVGKGVIIRQTARVTYPWKVVFGEHCWVGDHAEIYSLSPITIGRHAVVSQKSYLCGATHDHHDLTFPLVGGPIVIGDEAWVAADCFVAPGVTIGRGSIIGARSTVLRDVPDAVIAAGYPAEVKASRAPATKGIPIEGGPAAPIIPGRWAKQRNCGAVASLPASRRRSDGLPEESRGAADSEANSRLPR
jgi:putative colanic acid biosynthesis acetyltransferase WcaF